MNELGVSYSGSGDFRLNFLGKHADSSFAETTNFAMQIDFSLSYSRLTESIEADGGLYTGMRVSDRLLWNMEVFPSLEIYQDRNGGTRRLAYDAEETPFLGIPFGLNSLWGSGNIGFSVFSVSEYWSDPFGPFV